MVIDGQKLILQRQRAGLSRKELANKAFVTYVRIWQIETEVKNETSMLLANAIGKALKIDPKKLEAV